VIGPPERKFPLAINGLLSPHGLGMHPNPGTYTRVRYRLAGKYKRFTSSVALNDSTGRCQSPLTFQVLGDGRLLWESAPVQKSRSKQDFSINVCGVQVLDLRVVAQDQSGAGHSIWFEPHVLK
jgi:alpha-galactosidase